MTKPRAPYTTNATLADIAARLRAATSVALFTHSKPDGDAVGSTLSVARALIRLGIKATPVYLAPWPSRMDPIVADTRVVHEKHGCWDEPWLKEVDAAAVLDTGSWGQLADARKWLEPRADITVLVDHHSHGDGDIAHLRYIDPSSASACELAAELCRILLNLDAYRQLPADIAEPIYLGVSTDTGWFRYSNMKPSTLRLAADLIEAGVDHNRLYRQVEQADTPHRLQLIKRALDSLELLDQDRAAIMTITKADVTACHASQDEVGGLTDLPQTIGTVRVIAVLTELEPTLTKVSLRSKAANPGQREIDVNALLNPFGGGGHFHAAGAKIKLPLAETKAKIARAITEVPK
ncbi:MAG: DHH family phosphoesterase [Phycisphaerae bacterium]|nr:DHH family phosphoesterase [Phycisphaerae bacterium]